MKIRIFSAALLCIIAFSALGHGSGSHSQRLAPPASCAPFEGKDVKTINLKKASVKAQYDKCQADKRVQQAAAKAYSEEL